MHILMQFSLHFPFTLTIDIQLLFFFFSFLILWFSLLGVGKKLVWLAEHLSRLHGRVLFYLYCHELQ